VCARACVRACVRALVDASVRTYHKLYCCLAVVAINDNCVFSTLEMPNVWFELVCRILKTFAFFFCL
jgi:hypothetical protein